MKRTLYALLICTAVVGVVLAVSLGFERAVIPPEVARFLRTAFGENQAEAVPVLRGTQSAERMLELAKRYGHMLGAFVEIKEERGRRRLADNRTEFDLIVTFAKTDAPVRIRVVEDGQGLGIEELWVDAPPAFEMPGTLKSLRRIAGQGFDALARQRPLEIYDHLAQGQREASPRADWGAAWRDRVEAYGVFDRVEALGEPQELEKDVYAFGHTLVFEKGTIVFRERWRYHDVHWILEELTYEESL